MRSDVQQLATMHLIHENHAPYHLVATSFRE